MRTHAQLPSPSRGQQSENQGERLSTLLGLQKRCCRGQILESSEGPLPTPGVGPLRGFRLDSYSCPGTGSWEGLWEQLWPLASCTLHHPTHTDAETPEGRLGCGYRTWLCSLSLGMVFSHMKTFPHTGNEKSAAIYYLYFNFPNSLCSFMLVLILQSNLNKTAPICNYLVTNKEAIVTPVHWAFMDLVPHGKSLVRSFL